MYWTYSALTRSGQEVVATVLGSRKVILEQLSQSQLSLIEIKPNYAKTIRFSLPRKKMSALSMAIFFEDFSNLLESGLSISHALLIFKDTGRNDSLSDVVSQIENKLEQGQSLAEAIVGINCFPWIVTAAISTGEKTGRLSELAGVLGRYFRNYHQLQHKIQQALVYPVIVFTLLLAVMFFVSVRVIPQMRSLLPTEALQYQTTQWLLVISSVMQEYVWVLIGLLGGLVGMIFYLKNKYQHQFQECLYRLPMAGNLLKESALALYLLNLAVLLKSGVSLIKAISDLNALEQSAVSKHFFLTRDYMLGGISFWQAIEKDQFFPLTISLTLRRAEEMARLEDYCHSLAEFFNRKVSSRMDGLIQMVQPVLLSLGGVFLVVIALAFLIPIYGSLTTIATGQ